ncbi:glycosyltransferase family 2 protein [Paenibacillus sp. NPDC056579]|uniref:glycosyltransferase family 2 protein n=1 Tax=Paenibacillus sp. NPDC056579 TaxID=3345871 RepID=UPI003681F042
MRLTSIIIPNYNGIKYLKPCVESILIHTSSPYEIIVVDNGSDDGSIEYCEQQKLKLISLPTNCGFPAACNYGLKMAVGDSLLLLNNDTLLTRNWLDNMLRCLYSSADIGIVGPVTNYATGKQKIKEPFTSLNEMAARYNDPDASKWHQVDRIVGLCFLFKRELMDRVGLMDERFSPGYVEDDDYCYRARLEGFRLMVAGDAFIYHKGGGSFRKKGRKAVRQLLHRNYAQFIAKWGVHPRSFI